MKKVDPFERKTISTRETYANFNCSNMTHEQVMKHIEKQVSTYLEQIQNKYSKLHINSSIKNFKIHVNGWITIDVERLESDSEYKTRISGVEKRMNTEKKRKEKKLKDNYKKFLELKQEFEGVEDIEQFIDEKNKQERINNIMSHQS